MSSPVKTVNKIEAPMKPLPAPAKRSKHKRLSSYVVNVGSDSKPKFVIAPLYPETDPLFKALKCDMCAKVVIMYGSKNVSHSDFWSKHYEVCWCKE